MSDAVQFFNEDIAYTLEREKSIILWIEEVAKEHSFEIEGLNFVLCSDEYLLKINAEHLNHHYYTDIITFDLSEKDNVLESDVFISIDRVKDNATIEGVSLDDELNRVIIHGILHLLGYNDKSEEEKSIMRKKEDACLSLLPEN